MELVKVYLILRRVGDSVELVGPWCSLINLVILECGHSLIVSEHLAEERLEVLVHSLGELGKGLNLKHVLHLHLLVHHLVAQVVKQLETNGERLHDIDVDNVLIHKPILNQLHIPTYWLFQIIQWRNGFFD